MTPDAVVVGSGPAGVSAAWPLVEAGLRVLMLDASGPPPPPPPTGSIGAFRRDPARWRHQFGHALAGLAADASVSPKLATPLAAAVLAAPEGLRAAKFHAFASPGAGGLSQIWGAMAPRFGPDDLVDFPFGLAALEDSYRRVEARIGVAPPPAFTSPLARLLARPGGDVVLEPARNAVLDGDRGDRLGCAQCGLCLYGCARRSVYVSSDELPALRARPNFHYRPGTTVQALRATADGHELAWAGGGASAKLVVLAAGTLATTGLAARRLGALDTPIRLLTNPVAAVAFLEPRLIGAPLPERSFALAQLRHEHALDGGGTAAGALYGADALPLAALAQRIPLSRPAALRASRALAPALILATIYLPGRFSDNRMRVGATETSIEGGLDPAAAPALRQAARRLGRAMRRRGAWPVPGSLAIAGPGADAHYAGTIPMAADDDPRPLACSPAGELRGAPGVFVVDGAALSALPSKHCTLTIMANADRIARGIVTTRVGRPAAR